MNADENTSTAPMGVTIVNVNLDVTELNRRGTTQTQDGFTSSHVEVYQQRQDIEDYSVKKGEPYMIKRRAAVGPNNRVNAVTSFNGYAVPRSVIDRYKEHDKKMTDEEAAMRFLEDTFRCGGLAQKSVAYEQYQVQAVDGPTMSVLGMADALNRGPLQICPMDLIQVRFPTREELRSAPAYGLNEGLTQSRGIPSSKVTAITVPFDPENTAPSVDKYLKYFEVATPAQAKLDLKTTRAELERDKCADAIDDAMRFWVLAGLLLATKQGIRGKSAAELEKLVGLAPIAQGEAAAYRVPSGSPDWAFAKEYVGAPIPKMISRICAGLPHAIAQDWTEIETIMTLKTRNLAMNSLANLISALNRKLAYENAGIIGVAQTGAMPGHEFQILLKTHSAA